MMWNKEVGLNMDEEMTVDEVWKMIENWIVIYQIFDDVTFVRPPDFAKTKSDIRDHIISLTKNHLLQLEKYQCGDGGEK